jgi:hypothetical protein
MFWVVAQRIGLPAVIIQAMEMDSNNRIVFSTAQMLLVVAQRIGLAAVTI